MKTATDIKIERLHKKAKQLLNQGWDENEVINELVKEGIDADYAGLIIINVKSDSRDRSDSWKLFFMGICFVAGGIYFNYFSYQMAANANSSFFFLFWRIVVAGIIMLIKAFSIYRR